MAEMNRKTNDGSALVDNREMDNNRVGGGGGEREREKERERFLFHKMPKRGMESFVILGDPFRFFVDQRRRGILTSAQHLVK